MDMEKVGAALAPIVRAAIEKATAPLIERIAELEARKLPEAIKGDPGRDGQDGKDGASVTLEDVERALEGRVAGWALDFERRAHGVLERAVDRMPKPADGRDGKDGADGLGFDDLSVDYDGGRGFVFKFKRGDVVKAFPFFLPVVIDAGYWKEGMQAKAGDGVTCGGSYWIAKRDTGSKPGVSDDWRLAVKKGRDGKDGGK